MDCSPQAPLSMELSKQEYWSWLPFPYPADLPNPVIEPGSPALQAIKHQSKTLRDPPTFPYGSPSLESRWKKSVKSQQVQGRSLRWSWEPPGCRKCQREKPRLSSEGKRKIQGAGEPMKMHRKWHWASVALSTFFANQSAFIVTPPAQLITQGSSFGSSLKCFQFNNPC